MNSAPYAPHTPHAAGPNYGPTRAAGHTATHAPAETGSSFHLVAGLAIGLALGGALVGALLYWARPNQPKPWHGRIRDELAEQVKQLQKVAAAVAHEIERG